MYFIIETIEQLEMLEHSQECFLQIIPNNYNFHPSLTTACAYYYRTNDKGYIICVNHSEAFSIPENIVKDFIRKHNKVYVLDKKRHSYYIDTDNLIDLLFFDNKELEIKTKIQSEYDRKYYDSEELNSMIPIVKHYEHLEHVYSEYHAIIKKARPIKNLDRLIEAYSYVEKNPIKVKYEDFVSINNISNPKISIKEDKVYTRYNLYNQTGRPTNTFNGVNFLAIPKDEPHRSCIIPDNDFFVEFDFDAYHLRIIANEVKYEFPNSSVHEYLGKQYFKKDTLTEEEYKQSKAISFKNLYGSVPEDHQHIPFFNRMLLLANFLSESCAPGESLELPTGIKLKREEDMNPSKLLNYYVQNLETKYNVDKILKIKDILQNKKTRLVLITYDAFLFDYSVEDGKELLVEIKKVLEQNNTPTKHKHGKNYFLQNG